MQMQAILVLIQIGFHAFDFLLGFVGAVKTKTVQSSKMRDGLFKKVGFLACDALAIGISYAQNYIDLGFRVDLLPYIVGYSIVTEIISIVENIGIINPDIFEKIKNIFKKEGTQE